MTELRIYRHTEPLVTIKVNDLCFLWNSPELSGFETRILLISVTVVKIELLP
jgi:hypothetical protein